MARRRFGGGGAQFSRQGRKLTQWSGFTSGTAVTNLAAATIVLDQVGIPNVQEQTVVRTRGILTIINDQQAATRNVHGAFGIAIVEEPAATIGVTAVPSPISDIGSDAWFVWLPFELTNQFASAIGFNTPAQSNFMIESKAMRKLSIEQRLVFVVENEAVAGGLNYHFSLRMLSKLGRM